jgi:hypothetical protein
MAKNFSFKKSKPQKGEIGKSSEKIVFGFSEIRPYSYVDSHNDSSFFISFLDRLKKLSSIDWNTANTSGRHSFGMEKMYVCDMTKAAQTHVPEGMESLLVFRATGDNHVFLGYREDNIFQVIFIEYQFGDVYSHNH